MRLITLSLARLMLSAPPASRIRQAQCVYHVLLNSVGATTVAIFGTYMHSDVASTAWHRNTLNKRSEIQTHIKLLQALPTGLCWT